MSQTLPKYETNRTRALSPRKKKDFKVKSFLCILGQLIGPTSVLWSLQKVSVHLSTPYTQGHQLYIDPEISGRMA